MINFKFMRGAFFNRSKRTALELETIGAAADGGTEAAVQGVPTVQTAQTGQVIPLERRKTRQRRARDLQQRKPDEGAHAMIPPNGPPLREQPPERYKERLQSLEALIRESMPEQRKRTKATILRPIFGVGKQKPLIGAGKEKPLFGSPPPKQINDIRQRKRTTVIPIKPEREPAILWDQ